LLRSDSSVWLAWPKLAKQAKAGGARRVRTADLVIANDALYQLSFGPYVNRVDAVETAAIGAIYSPRECQVKNAETSDFRDTLPELPLFEGGGTDI
jgi:hypothetical protein